MSLARMERPRIYFAGVGGQGTLTATKLLAQTALDAGIEAVAGEVHGMAQRGGVVESALLLGGWRAPRLDKGEADILLGFEPLETLRALPYLREGGIVFSSSDILAPLSVSLGQASYPSLDEIEKQVCLKASACFFLACRQLGQQAGALAAGNSALLGMALASGCMPMSVNDLALAIETHMPAKMRASNMEAMALGAKYMAEQFEN